MEQKLTHKSASDFRKTAICRAPKTQPFNEGGVSTNNRPRPVPSPTAVTEDFANLPPVAAFTSPSLRLHFVRPSTPPPHSSLELRSRNAPTRRQSRPIVSRQLDMTPDPPSAIAKGRFGVSDRSRKLTCLINVGGCLFDFTRVTSNLVA